MILVSACLVGINCRFDGTNRLNEKVLSRRLLGLRQYNTSADNTYYHKANIVNINANIDTQKNVASNNSCNAHLILSISVFDNFTF